MIKSVEMVKTKLSKIFINDVCYQNLTDDLWTTIERNIDATPSLLFRIFGVYPLIVCIPSLIINMIFVYVTIQGAIEKKLPRKLYIFLINRALGDILYLLITISLALGCIFQDGYFSLDLLAVVMVVNYLSFWASMVGFVSLSLLKLCSLVAPLHTRKLVTNRRCVWVVLLSWVFALVYTTFLLILLSLTMLEQLAKWSKCTPDSCIRTAFAIEATLNICCYTLTLTIFFATLIVSHKIQKKSKLSTSQPHLANLLSSTATIRLNRTSNPVCQQVRLQKLGLSVAIFALLYSLPAFAAFRYLFRYNKCYYSLGWYRALTFIGATKICFALRTLIDPIINFCTHRRLRETFKEILTSRRKSRRNSALNTSS